MALFENKWRAERKKRIQSNILARAKAEAARKKAAALSSRLT